MLFSVVLTSVRNPKLKKGEATGTQDKYSMEVLLGSFFCNKTFAQISVKAKFTV